MAARTRSVPQKKAVITCTPKQLPRVQWESAAEVACKFNPVNRPAVERLMSLDPDFKPTRAEAAVLTTKYWGAAGVRLTVGFLDNPPADLRARILLHMNAWGDRANVTFVASRSNPQVRIARLSGRDGGYWSYLGTDILSIPSNEPTMNLEGFTMGTSEAEFKRVVRHETGHTMGFPHEHMRRELVALIDRAKAIAHFGRTQGWSPAEVDQQVLTPLEDGSILGTPTPDPNSIMCYQIPGEITKSGVPIPGGKNITAKDFAFAKSIYPKP